MPKKLTVNGTWQQFVTPLEKREAFTTHGSLAGGPVNGYGMIERGQLSLGWWTILMDEPELDYIVWSYRTPIAWHSRNGWTMPHETYSVTTSKQQGRIRTAIDYLNNMVVGQS